MRGDSARLAGEAVCLSSRRAVAGVGLLGWVGGLAGGSGWAGTGGARVTFEYVFRCFVLCASTTIHSCHFRLYFSSVI